MKRIFFLTTLITLISCNKDEVSPKCSQIDTLTVSQQIDVLNYSITASGSPATYELVLLDASYQSNPDNGQIISLEKNKGTIDLNKYASQNKSYKVYARAMCTNGEKSNWSTPSVVFINNYCNKPDDLKFASSSSLIWGDSNYSSVSYYQVQYGLFGFTLGQGTIASSNTNYLSNIPMYADTTYDFYVRSYCNDGKGWSSWAGPYTYYSKYMQNLCSVPTNLSYSVDSQTSSYSWVALKWNYNGESDFEFTVVSEGASVTSGTVYTASTSGFPVINLKKGYNYHFYVRSVCANGNKTGWSTAKLIDL